MSKFKPTGERTSLISNEVFERHRYKLSLNALKVLFGLTQCVDHTIDIFKEVEIDITGFWDYLDITTSEHRWSIVRDAIYEITENPLQYSTEDAKRWSSIPWLSAEFDSERSNYVTICFSDQIKPFLLNLKKYVAIQGKYITKLQSKFGIIFYMHLKAIKGAYYGKHVVTIKRLMEITNTDDPKKHPSYHDLKNGKANFMARVLGLKKSGKDYIINEKGPLGEINRVTEINVSVKVLKTGRTIDRIEFTVLLKKEENKKNIGIEQVNYSKLSDKKKPTTWSQASVFQAAKEANMSVKEFASIAGYKLVGNKYVKASEEWIVEQKRLSLFDKATQ